MADLTSLNQAPQTALAAYGDQGEEAYKAASIQEQRNAQLYNGFQGVVGSQQQVADTEGAQGNLYSGGAQQAAQANKQDYAYAQGQIHEGLRSTLANLTLNRFLTATGSSGS